MRRQELEWFVGDWPLQIVSYHLIIIGYNPPHIYQVVNGQQLLHIIRILNNIIIIKKHIRTSTNLIYEDYCDYNSSSFYNFYIQTRLFALRTIILRTICRISIF